MIEKHALSALPVVAVSLGPGDPDLITVAGLKALQQADKVYYPGALREDGTEDSYAKSILLQYPLPNVELEGYFLKMSKDRAQAKRAYKVLANSIKADCLEGKQIAVVAEGDLSTYSSLSYVVEALQAKEVEVNLIPGITSFALLAAMGNTPIGVQRQKITILPEVIDAPYLIKTLQEFDTVILMKIKPWKKVLRAVLEYGQYSLCYGEHLGTEKGFISRNWEEINKRNIPYFSLLIINK